MAWKIDFNFFFAKRQFLFALHLEQGCLESSSSGGSIAQHQQKLLLGDTTRNTFPRGDFVDDSPENKSRLILRPNHLCQTALNGFRWLPGQAFVRPSTERLGRAFSKNKALKQLCTSCGTHCAKNLENLSSRSRARSLDTIALNERKRGMATLSPRGCGNKASSADQTAAPGPMQSDRINHAAARHRRAQGLRTHAPQVQTIATQRPSATFCI